jgi:hypothetical protein
LITIQTRRRLDLKGSPCPHATKVATACPFCLSMFDEGIASKELGERLAVDDVAVYVARSLAGAAGDQAVAAISAAEEGAAESQSSAAGATAPAMAEQDHPEQTACTVPDETPSVFEELPARVPDEAPATVPDRTTVADPTGPSVPEEVPPPDLPESEPEGR